jgi:hypothetical protein
MAFLFQRYTSTIKGSERESDGTAAFTQLSSPAEPRGTDVGHRHPLGRGRRGSDWWPFHLGRHTQRSANKLIRDNLALLQTQLRVAIALDRMLSLLKAFRLRRVAHLQGREQSLSCQRGTGRLIGFTASCSQSRKVPSGI